MVFFPWRLTPRGFFCGILPLFCKKPVGLGQKAVDLPVFMC
jgi:hypothetical protein